MLNLYQRLNGAARGAIWTVVGGLALALLQWLGPASLAQISFEAKLREKIPEIDGRVATLEKERKDEYSTIIKLLKEIKHEPREEEKK